MSKVNLQENGHKKKNGHSNKQSGHHKKNSKSKIKDDSNPYIDRLREKFVKIMDERLVIGEDEKVSFGWEGITYTHKKIKKSCCKVVSKEKKYILKDVSGIAEPGRLVAIMGPSGAGKTSLLNALSKRIENKKALEGHITINGRKSTKKELFACSSFVAQDDILLGSATPFELLYFNAKMKLPDRSDEDIKDLVLSLLKNLGLEAVKDSLIGYSGQHSRNSGITRGLSGGERKRVSICFELISNPKLLFLDEPTSGLDAFAAKAVIENLRNLAFTGRTIITTIHQPSAEMFNLFDDLCVLAEGKVVYFGPAHLAADHFASLGHPVPDHTNHADFFVRVLRKSNKTDTNDPENGISFASTTSEGQVKSLIKGYKKSERNLTVLKTIESSRELVKDDFVDNSKRPGGFTQLGLLVKRTAKSLIREPMLMRMRFVQALFLAVLGGLIWLRQKDTQAGVSDRVSAAFFMLNSNMIGALSGPNNVFPPERSFFFRERKTNTYSTALYYISKLVLEIPFIAILAIVSNTIFFFMVGFNDNAESWILFIVATILIAFAGHSAGMFISCAVLDLRIATTVVQPLIMFPLMLFSGFFLNPDNIPVYFIWAEYASFMKYAFRAAVNCVFGLHFRIFECDPDQPCRFPNSQEVTKFYFSDGHAIWLDFVTIIIIGVLFHILAFIFLYVRGRKSQ